MRYILMIYSSEAADNAMSPAEMGTVLEAYGAFGQELVEKNAMLGGERLRPVETATTVRIRDGKETLTDGPFAETKEQLGGFYMIEAKDLDEAVAWAKKIPSAAHGSVEVRPIWEMEEEQN